MATKPKVEDPVENPVESAFVAACSALVVPPGDPQYLTVDVPDYGPLRVRISAHV